MESYQKPQLTTSILWLMAISSGLVVANIYYNQPLLSLIASEFRTSQAAVSKIAMLTQVGYAAGLLLIVPLGDLLPRKRLIVIDFVLIIVSVLGMATSNSLILLYVFSFLIGLTGVIPQVFIPLTASLTHAEKRTQAIGLVMSGLLIGILGSRVISGWIGNLYGWRTVFYVAASLMLILWLLIIRKLPEVQPGYKGKYSSLMKSVFHYARTEPLLQAASLRGGLLFASFSAFWTSLIFLLAEAPFHGGSALAGSFGILGILGAIMAVFVGKLSKKFRANNFLTALLLVFILSWLIFGLYGHTYTGLVIGIIVLDVALQGAHIMNQSSIFSLHPQANNRINTVYMTTYFLGGALGTFLAGLGWQCMGWNGVIATGVGLSLLALFVHLTYYKKQEKVLVPDLEVV